MHLGQGYSLPPKSLQSPFPCTSTYLGTGKALPCQRRQSCIISPVSVTFSRDSAVSLRGLVRVTWDTAIRWDPCVGAPRLFPWLMQPGAAGVADAAARAAAGSSIPRKRALLFPWAAGIGKAFHWSISFEEKVLISQHWRWSPHLQSLACLRGTESSRPPSSAHLAQAAPLGLPGIRDTGTDLREPSAPCVSVPCAATSYLSWRHWFLLLQPTTHSEG